MSDEKKASLHNYGMNYEWDENKAKTNFIKHAVTFDEAKTVFDDPLYVDFFDPDHSIEECRYLRLGLSAHQRLLLVSYTERCGTIRIISARFATRSERKSYEHS
jgi:uncharacterized DUF497 family protein